MSKSSRAVHVPRGVNGILSRDDSTGFFRGIVKARTYKRRIPEWAKNDTKVRELIVRAFPHIDTSPTHRAGAARWAAIIHLYFRMGYTRSQIAEEIGSTIGKIHGAIRSILRVSKGLRADGNGKLKSGCPKSTVRV